MKNEEVTYETGKDWFSSYKEKVSIIGIGESDYLDSKTTEQMKINDFKRALTMNHVSMMEQLSEYERVINDHSTCRATLLVNFGPTGKLRADIVNDTDSLQTMLFDVMSAYELRKPS